MEDSRCFRNKFQDSGEEIVNCGKLRDDLEKTLKAGIQRLLIQLDTGLQDGDTSDVSVYTGISGIAMLYFHLYNVFYKKQEDSILSKAQTIIYNAAQQLKGKRCTFLCGDAGPLALMAVLNNESHFEFKMPVKRLCAIHEEVMTDTSVPDELLYGRSGYLYALLYVQKHLGHHLIKSDIIEKVFVSVIESGQELSKKLRSPCPLIYMWHDKIYLGAAHGLAGILTVLMQVVTFSEEGKFNSYMEDFIRPSVDYLMTLKFPSGNYPSSVGSSSGDTLIHWCHGAPGWIHMFIIAYKVFKDEKYLKAAKECADVIWDRGLLTKGYGLCHGVAGNGYGLLALYNVTKEQKYIYRCWKFAEWCLDYGKHGCRVADRPYSLFEGLAGTIYFLADLLNMENAKFPALYV